MLDNTIFPCPLQQGDKIAIVSPAGIVNSAFVDSAIEVLAREGWQPYVGKHALGTHGSYSSCIEHRYEDIADALLDNETRAILCSRGGYGAVHLLDKLSLLPLEQDPKWLIGFSDISALHALMASKSIASIHSSMAKHLAKENGTDSNSDWLFSILRGKLPHYEWGRHTLNRCGLANGKLIGGNLAVMQALINTPYDIFTKDIILFIEDIGEPIYKVQRMLYQLKLSGILQSLRGLIVGQFTNYHPDANYHDMETMIREMIDLYDYPVTFNSPIGHIDNNIPLIESANVVLTISPETTTLHFQ